MKLTKPDWSFPRVYIVPGQTDSPNNRFRGFLEGNQQRQRLVQGNFSLISTPKSAVGGMITHRCFSLSDTKWPPTNCFPSRNPLSDAFLKRPCLNSVIPQFYLLKMKLCAPADGQEVPPRPLGTINNSSGVLQRGSGMSFLSACSKDTLLIWRHLKRFLKYVFIYHLETEWVFLCRYALNCKLPEDRNQVGLICFLGHIM